MNTLKDTWKKLIWWQKSLVVATICTALYAAFGFLLLPYIARYVVVEKVSPALNRQISVGEIRFNPFALTADISGLSIAERDGAGEFVAFDSLHADLELSSIPRLSLVVRNVSLEGPRIHIRLDENGQTNFSDLTGGPKEPSPQDPGEPMLLPVIVEPFTVGNGTLTFDDQARGVSHVVDRINFKLPRFSSRKKDWETFMTPTLSFRVNGAPFNLEGRTIPFSNSLKTEFDLNVVDLGLPQYWAYAMASENLELAKGLLNLETKLAFEQHEDALPTFSLQGTITGHDIELTDNGEPVLSAASTQIVMDDISILNLELGLNSVTLEKPFLRIVRGRDGSLNWMHYFASGDAGKAGEAMSGNSTEPVATKAANATVDAVADEPDANATIVVQDGNATAPVASEIDSDMAARRARAKALLLQAPKIRLNDGRILFRDETTSFVKEIESLSLTITDLDTSVNATTEGDLRIRTAEGEELVTNATFSVTPFRVQALIEARDLDIPSYAPYFRDALPLTLATAKADARINFAIDGEDKAPRLSDSSLEVRGLTLEARDGAGEIRLGRAVLDRIFLDLADREIGTGVLTLEEAIVSTGLDANGRATLPDALQGRPADAKQAPTPSAGPDGAAWKMTMAGAAVKGLDLNTGDKDAATPVSLDALQVGQVTVDTGAQSVAVGPVELGLAVDLVRLKNGDLNLARLFAPKPDAPKAPAASKPSPPAWAVTVASVSLAGSSVTLTDQTLPKPSRVDVDQISFTTKNLSTDLDKAIPLELSCRIEETGTVKASGDIVPSTLVTKGTATLSRIPLSLASAYVADAAAVDIPAGRLGGRLNWRMGGKGREQITGSLNVDGLRITEARSRAEIAGFRALGLEQVTLQLSPLALSIGTVNLLEPRASFVIDGQGRTTLDRIAPSAKKPAAGKAAKKDSSEGLKTLDIASFAMKQGRFTFTDQTLSPQFASVISPVDLNVRGISLDPQKKADIELSAVIDGTAPINATGWVSPLKDPVEANSTVTLRNLDLVALSPYSAKFIAYPVAQGQLDWDLDLSTQGSNLAMRNAIKARQLELGDKVESPDAVDAPVKLGLALLRDMSGNIAINLPVKGDLNDPKFSIGGIVLQAFLGLIIKAVASPFSLLASLVPEGAADLSKLAFPPGLATPAQESMDSITSLADILKQRPGISISVVGHADPAADRQAMADSQFLRKLQVVKYDGLSRKEREGVEPETLEITDEEYADVLWEAYKEEPVEKKKNFLGIHEDVPREEQEAKLRELIRVTDEDLVRLAASRAEFVKNRLVQELGVDAGRVFMGGTGPQSLSGAHEVTVEIRK
jgi:uncharacterized protein involved in outer membrane biogenesis